MNAEVLKSRSELPDILSIVSNHLFGQLEGYIITSDKAVTGKCEVSSAISYILYQVHILLNYLTYNLPAILFYSLPL